MSWVLISLLTFFAGIVIWFTMAKPFVGLLVLVALTPFGSLFNLPAGLTAGRLVGVLVVISWLLFLVRNKAARARFQHRKLRFAVIAFSVSCFMGWMLGPYFGVETRSISYTLRLELLVFMSLMIENLVDKKRKLGTLLLVMALSSIAGAALPVAYHFGLNLYAPLGIDPELTIVAGRAQGLTGNANGLGVMASTGFFAALILIIAKQRFVSAFGLMSMATILVGALILSGSRTHLVAFVVFSVLYLFLRFWGPRRGVGWSLTGLVLLTLVGLGFYSRAPKIIQSRLVVFGPHVDTSTVRRENFIKTQRREALDAFGKYPILGIGLGAFHSRYGMDAHDTITALVGETGFVGVMAFLILMISTWRWLYMGSKVGRLTLTRDPGLFLYSAGFIAGLVTMLIAGLGGYVVFYQRWFWITVGISPVIARWAEQNEKLYRVSQAAKPVHSRQELRMHSA